MLPFSNPLKLTKFILCSQELSGYGFAKMLLDESTGRGQARRNEGNVDEVILAISPKEDEDDFEHLDKVGDGVVQKMELEECFKNRKDYKTHLWVFDMNFGHEMADTLRKEGYFVIGGQEFTDKLEHDREYGLSLVEKAGIKQPTSHTFNDIQSGLDLIDSDPLIAWVFKPDEPDNESWVTTTPDSDNDEQANREMYRFLAAQSEKGTYILQERVKGIEINVEMWLYKGTPFFSFANFECKRKDNGDHGRMIGCAQDIGFKIDLNSKILKDTLWKLVSLPEFSDYTGFIDINLIIADNEYYFLEFCGRFGYNSHPNLFLTLAIDPLSTILSDFVLGNIDDFYSHFRGGFGASITTWIDKPVAGLPLMFDNDQDVESRFYHFDTYKEDDEWFLAGYANEVGVICAHDYDVNSAAEECLRKFDKIHYPGKTGRTDLMLKNYQSNPQERYIACQSLGLFEKGESND
jgi:phosphoribosylamine-glycine ligase